ncbi:hypothetical protein GRI75_02110 [Altererythrobacter soli]|uniref:Uncharacterized protein n=1 Tax=Croceibacterium soli TaxID=1739690 RepID=A0A6I4UN92_9SPHN|nr:hypothetical protein [Croceibacterium soli]MXP40440.1 hypothetical protein [Croceibacterium soli]
MTGRTMLVAALLLAGCGEQDNDPGPGGVTVGEARALDEAAEMLEQQRLPQDVLEGGEAQPEAENPSPAPSSNPGPA